MFLSAKERSGASCRVCWEKHPGVICQAAAQLRCCLDTNWQKLSLFLLVCTFKLFVATVRSSVSVTRIPQFHLSVKFGTVTWSPAVQVAGFCREGRGGMGGIF